MRFHVDGILLMSLQIRVIAQNLKFLRPGLMLLGCFVALCRSEALFDCEGSGFHLRVGELFFRVNYDQKAPDARNR